MAKPAHRPLGYRSSWESQYAEHLKALKTAGTIQSWAYEAIRLRIADKGVYTPDFMVVTPEEIQMHEVKGQRREAGMVRLRTAAHQHRWARFFLVTKTRGNWVIEEVA